VEATFATLAAISDHKAIVCSEKGDVCLLDDSEGQKLMKLANTGFPITCIAVDLFSRIVRIGGRNGKMKSMGLDELLSPSTPPESPIPLGEVTASDVANLCAMGYAAKSLITIDSKHSIGISNLDPETGLEIQNKPFPAHGDAVLGVELLASGNEMNAAFLTWSANGTIVFWNLDGSSTSCLNVEIEQNAASEEDPANQCQIVRSSKNASFLVTGDRYGVVRVINPSTQECKFQTRAHMSDIQDIVLFESEETTLMASCGRDRTVQLFRLMAGQWELIQTLDEHSASVCSLLFAESGEKLISASSDRTIHVRQLVKKEVGGQEVMGAVPVRVITLKASPVSMAPCLDDPMSCFIVSSMDRTVATYEIGSGRLVSSFKATDNDGADAVVLDALVMGRPGFAPGRPTILAGISSTDKSVRVYDGLSGSFLDREWGHTAAVTDVALLEPLDSDQKFLISTGSDGTIMIWDLSPKPDLNDPPETTRDPSPPKEITTAKPPLRRVLSRAEMAEFQRASPMSTPTGRTSPPRVVRRKTSRYGLTSQSPAIPPVPSVNPKHLSSTSDESSRKGSPRNRSRSPPPSPKGKESRRPSLASMGSGGSLGRAKSANFSEFGSLNMATEQACRTLRAYRKKLLSAETVREETLKELDWSPRPILRATGVLIRREAPSHTTRLQRISRGR
jgi:WD40 repeat protein